MKVYLMQLNKMTEGEQQTYTKAFLNLVYRESLIQEFSHAPLGRNTEPIRGNPILYHAYRAFADDVDGTWLATSHETTAAPERVMNLAERTLEQAKIGGFQSFISGSGIESIDMKIGNLLREQLIALGATSAIEQIITYADSGGSKYRYSVRGGQVFSRRDRDYCSDILLRKDERAFIQEGMTDILGDFAFWENNEAILESFRSWLIEYGYKGRIASFDTLGDWDIEDKSTNRFSSPINLKKIIVTDKDDTEGRCIGLSAGPFPSKITFLDPQLTTNSDRSARFVQYLKLRKDNNIDIVRLFRESCTRDFLLRNNFIEALREKFGDSFFVISSGYGHVQIFPRSFQGKLTAVNDLKRTIGLPDSSDKDILFTGDSFEYLGNDGTVSEVAICVNVGENPPFYKGVHDFATNRKFGPPVINAMVKEQLRVFQRRYKFRV